MEKVSSWLDMVEESDACPNCRENRTDRLLWIDDERVECVNCGRVYRLDGQANSNETHD